MLRTRWFQLAAGMAALGISGFVLTNTLSADDTTAAPGGLAGLKAEGGEAKAEAGDEKDKPKRFPPFNDQIKDMKATEGLFTFYRYDPSDKNRDPEKMLMRIPKAMLSEDFLFATSISRGGPLTGFMWMDYLARWEMAGNQLKLVTPDTNYIQKSGEPTTDAVKRTYNNTWIAAVPIVSIADNGDVLIDAGALLKSNIADVSFVGGTVRPELSEWTKVKSFPENVLVEVDLAMQRGSEGNQVGVAYGFRKLPKLNAYEPRLADPRIGYFLTARIDWAKDNQARDLFERYVNRWQLEKQNPALDLSPPKQPIVFIIEKTVPIQWRRWVKEGILEWNKAFEKIGYVDAVVVQQQTDDNEFAEYDPEDAHYNFFRWIVSGRAFAMGPSRVDPRTGQILDADIIMDDSFVRAWLRTFDMYAPGAVAGYKGEAFIDYMNAHPELMTQSMQNLLSQPRDPADILREIASDKLAANGHEVCCYAEGMAQQMSFVYSAMIATGSGKKMPEHFIGEAIREVVAHEVGHTLGLRHNFKASAWLSMEEIQKRRNTDEPTTASVMDYNPLLFFVGDQADTARNFVTPTVGPYDVWAIEYGYRTDKAKPEKDLLKEIASRCTQPGLAYATDEDTMWVLSPDPAVNRYDMGSDPVVWARTRIELCDKLMENLPAWSVQEGEPRYYITQAFNILMNEKARNLSYVARVVGGQSFNRDHVGDPDARPAFVLVPPDQQRTALKLITETLFTEEFFKLDPELLNQLSVSRWSHYGASAAARVDYPIHDRVSMLQTMTLVDLISSPVLQRVYDAELKSKESDKFTAAELITTVRDQIWSALDKKVDGTYSNSRPFIGSITRNLQREHLDLMLTAAQTTPGYVSSPDLHGMVCFSVRQLSEKIGKTLKDAKLDFATQAHLSECKSRIDRVLDAQFQAR